MKNPKIMIDCALGTLTAFFAFPIIMLAVPSVTFLSLTLLFIFPVLSFICGILCGKENGFQIYYPLLVGVFFLQTVFLFYDTSVWPMMMFYMVIALAGVAIGHFINVRSSGKRPNGRLK